VTIGEHLSEFAGYPVVEWDEGLNQLESGKAYRITLDYELGEKGTSWTDLFAQLLDQPGAQELEGIVVGAWGEEYEGSERVAAIVEALVSARERLPKLKLIFFGDVTYEECEISWLDMNDLSPLLKAYPNLEHFGVRGSNNLTLGQIEHAKLRSIVLQSGGLPNEIVQQVINAKLPNLEHFELWLGSENYGGDSTISDLEELLEGKFFPKLSYLGLRNSEYSDEIAYAIVKAPILERIKILDLSMGTLGDKGALVLLESEAVKKLKKLDIHHHYCSDEMVARLQKLPIELDASDPQEEDDEFRYVAVSE
jgi:hypothetical protein